MISPNDARFTARLKAEYDKSLGVLLPIKAQLARTDALIDQIVYRFLKIGLADEQTVERRLVDALARAQAIAQERGITDQDIEDEIRAVRSGQ